MKLILASKSPRRKELLKEIIDDFDIIPAKGSENLVKGISPKENVIILSNQKASEVFSQHTDSIVLGADTIVAINGVILGKPKDAEDAKYMLKMLSGKKHQVYTGVTLIVPTNENVNVLDEYEKTDVEFNCLSEEFIEDYVKSGSPMDKAGAYGIQDGGLVKSISGSYSNVVGLPQELVRKMLSQFIDVKGIEK